MKKTTTFRLVALLACLCVMSCTFVGSTLAKYTSTVTGTAEATVATWSFEVNDVNIATNPATTNFNVNLFETIKDTDGDGTQNETDVKTTKIAPGTHGEFNIKLDNTSEVTANYTIAATLANNNNIPLKFKVNNAQEWSNDLTIPGGELNMETGTATAKIEWMWDYEGSTPATDNVTDTNLGIGGTATAVVDITVTATQKD